jgi:DNA-binding transcriptional MerR regulator
LDFTIGEFSRITGLSIKALRLYHEKEILIPGHIDPGSSYRYYDDANVDKAKIIVYLRDMEFALADIKDILSNYNDEANLVDALARQKKRISEKIRRYESVMQILDDIIDREAEAGVALEKNPMRVEEKRLKPFLIAGIRFNGKYSEIGRYFGRLADRMRENISGVPMGLYYDGEYKEENADIEACFPIQSEKTVSGIRTRELQGGKCFSLLHHGAYENIGNAYARLLTHLKSEGAALRLPFRESYIKGPGLIIKGNPENFLTEIQIMVAG